MFDGTYEDYERAANAGGSKIPKLNKQQWEQMRDFDKLAMSPEKAYEILDHERRAVYGGILGGNNS